MMNANHDDALDHALTPPRDTIDAFVTEGNEADGDRRMELIRVLLCDIDHLEKENRRQDLTYDNYIDTYHPDELLQDVSISDSLREYELQMRPTRGEFYRAMTLIREMLDDEYRRDDLSHLLMQHSLCPMHFCDWAICFDDDDPECSQIRAIFPHGHDT